MFSADPAADQTSAEEGIGGGCQLNQNSAGADGIQLLVSM